MTNDPDAKETPIDGQAPETAPAAQEAASKEWIGVVLFLLIPGVYWAAARIGMIRGPCIGAGDPGSILSGVSLVLAPVLLLLAIEAGRTRSPERRSVVMVFFFPILLVGAYATFVGGEVFGGAQARSFVSRTKVGLRTISAALENYAVEYKTYPERLDALTAGGSMGRIPRSPFGNHPSPNYATIGTKSWLVWMPGPDKDWDIDETTVKEIRDVAGAGKTLDLTATSSLLLSRTYDSSNGLVSSGDIFRCR